MKHVLALAALLGALVSLAGACSSNTIASPTGDGGAQACLEAAKDDHCPACTAPANASPTSCRAPRNVSACCTFVASPTRELARGTGLNRYSSTDPTLKLGSLVAPGALEAPWRGKPVIQKLQEQLLMQMGKTILPSLYLVTG